VIDGDTGEGIPDVNVNLHRFLIDSPKDYFVLTDEKGNFTFSNFRAGRYCLNYFALYPYASLPAADQKRVEYERGFIINEGEIKEVIQPLEKGGEIIQNFDSSLANMKDEYKVNSSYIHIIVNDKLFEPTLIALRDHPKFTRSNEGIKYTGMAAGQYILSRSYEKMPEYYSENNVDFAGVITRFTLDKQEQKKIDVVYDSKSKIIIKLQCQDNMTFQYGRVGIFKHLTMNGKEYYYNVWLKRLKQPIIINPIIIEPGEYFIRIYSGRLKNSNGDEIRFSGNEFLFYIGENETKEINCLILAEGRDLSLHGYLIY
jgi:hypothetical protein